jgi:hypothetical protein
MDIGQLKRDLQHAVDRARQERERTDTPADVDIVASTADHEIDLVTKRSGPAQRALAEEVVIHCRPRGSWSC